MEKTIIKLTYDNGLVVGLCRDGKYYYVFWGNTLDTLIIDHQWGDDVEEKASLTIPFIDNKGHYIKIMYLDKEGDYELAERLLRAALVYE